MKPSMMVNTKLPKLRGVFAHILFILWIKLIITRIHVGLCQQHALLCSFARGDAHDLGDAAAGLVAARINHRWLLSAAQQTGSQAWEVQCSLSLILVTKLLLFVP